MTNCDTKSQAQLEGIALHARYSTVSIGPILYLTINYNTNSEYYHHRSNISYYYYTGRIKLFKEITRKRRKPPYHLTMKNVSHKKSWNSGVMQPHVGPPPIFLIKCNHKDNNDKYFVKLKLSTDTTSS